MKHGRHQTQGRVEHGSAEAARYERMAANAKMGKHEQKGDSNKPEMLELNPPDVVAQIAANAEKKVRDLL